MKLSELKNNRNVVGDVSALNLERPQGVGIKGLVLVPVGRPGLDMRADKCLCIEKSLKGDLQEAVS